MLLSTLNRLQLIVHRVEEYHRMPTWKIDRIDRPYSVFWYVFSGEKSVEIGGVKYEVSQGDLVIFPAQVPFELYINEKSIPLHHIDFAIEYKFGPFDFLTLYEFPIIIKPEKNDHLKHLLTLWHEIKNHPEKMYPYSNHENKLKLELVENIEMLRFSALVNQWLAELLCLFQPYSDELTLSFDPRLHQVVFYIQNHLHDKLSLRCLAKQVFLSESHLSLLFRQKLKISPMEYVRQARLHKARELLLTTNYRLKEIAEAVGFGEQSQLSRAFRQAVGISPLDYRKGEGL